MIAGPVTPRASRLISLSTCARQRVALEEGAGAEQAQFLALVEQEGDRPRQRLAREHRRRSPASSRRRCRRRPRPGPAGVAVVMGDEQQMAALRRADRRDHVAHPGAVDAARLARMPLQAKSSLTRGLEPDRAQLRDQPLAHRVALPRCRPGAAAGRRGCAPAAPRARSASNPPACWSGGARAAVSSAPFSAIAREQQQEQRQQQTASAHHPPLPCRPRPRMPYRFPRRACDRRGAAIQRRQMRWVTGWSWSARPAMSGARCSTSSPSANSRSTRSPRWPAPRSTGDVIDFGDTGKKLKVQQHRAFRFRRLGHRAVRRRLGRRRSNMRRAPPRPAAR